MTYQCSECKEDIEQVVYNYSNHYVVTGKVDVRSVEA